MSDGFTQEKMAATNHERKRLQAGAMSYEEKSATAAMKQKLEAEGFSSEKVRISCKKILVGICKKVSIGCQINKS